MIDFPNALLRIREVDETVDSPVGNESVPASPIRLFSEVSLYSCSYGPKSGSKPSSPGDDNDFITHTAHLPTRLVNNFGIVTTDTNGIILVTNSFFLKLIDAKDNVIGMPIQSLIELGLTVDGGISNQVSCSGKIVNVISKNKRVPVSLWLQRRSGDSVYLWVVEPIELVEGFIRMNEQNDIIELSSDISSILKEKPPIPLKQMLPSFSILKEYHYCSYCLHRNPGEVFPVEVSPTDEAGKLQIRSFGNISGLIVVDSDGKIWSCNQSFIQRLLGYELGEFVDAINIQDVLPDFYAILDSAQSPVTDASSPNISRIESPKYKLLRNRIVVHKDKSMIKVNVDVRKMKEFAKVLYAIWISYERPSLVENEKKAGYFSSNQKVPDLIPAPIQQKNEGRARQSLDQTQKFHNYEIIEQIGEGAFGTVYRALSRKYNISNVIVLKCIHKSKYAERDLEHDDEFGWVPREIKILNFLRKLPAHACLVRMISSFQDNEFYYIEMEGHERVQDLFDFIEFNDVIQEDVIRTIIHQVCGAIAFLHDNLIVHRDIKDENVIINHNQKIKLIDFGSAALVVPESKFTIFCGTIDYCPPEILLGQKYDGRPQDVWARKENPFLSSDEILELNLRIPYVPSEGGVGLLKSILVHNPKDRPSIQSILAHEWLNMKIT